MVPGKPEALRVLVDGEQHRAPGDGREFPSEDRKLLPKRRGGLVLGGKASLPRMPFLQVTLGTVHKFDHALVRLARVSAEAEEAVMEQHHADGALGGKLRVALGAEARQREARHDVRDVDHVVAVNLVQPTFAAGRVADGEQSVAVGVVDEFVREDRVQDCFDGGCWGIRTDGGRAELIGHFGVAEAFEPGKFPQPVHPHGREAAGLDRGEVPAAAFHVEQFDGFADGVCFPNFDRRVTTAVQHQRLVPTEQAGRVHPLCEVASPGSGLSFNP